MKQFTFFLLSIFFSLSLLSQEEEITEKTPSQNWSFTPLYSYQTGVLNEIVLPSKEDAQTSVNPYLSLLEWDIGELDGLGGELQYSTEAFLTSLSFLTSLTKKAGGMVDSDWYYLNLPYFSHQSVHTTELEAYFEGEGEIQAKIIEGENFLFLFGGGVKINYYSFTDKLISNIYSSGVNSTREYSAGDDLHDLIDSISSLGEKSISYKNTIFVLYPKITLQGELNPLTASLSFSASPFLFTGSLDQHHLTDIDYHDNFFLALYFATECSLKWELPLNLFLTTSFKGEWVPETRGDSSIYSSSGNYLGTSNGSVAFSHHATTWICGVGISF